MQPRQATRPGCRELAKKSKKGLIIDPFTSFLNSSPEPGRVACRGYRGLFTKVVEYLWSYSIPKVSAVVKMAEAQSALLVVTKSRRLQTVGGKFLSAFYTENHP